MTTPDLTTEYLGLQLAHPVVPSSSPLTGDIDTLHQLVEAGAPAVVLPSLFEEQIELQTMAYHFGLEFGAGSNPEAATGYLPELGEYNTGPHEYLQLVGQAATTLGIPVIASLNGASPGGWTRYARMLEDAGAAAIELNLYFMAADPEESAAEVEARCVTLVESVKWVVGIPVAVKLSPYFSSMASMAMRLESAGADALVLFNRFYQPDIDLETMQVSPRLVLSSPEESRLALRWIAILSDLLETDLAATSGVHSWTEVTKLILAGADVTMMASALLRRGPIALTEAVDGLRTWLTENEYESVSQAKGSLSRASAPDPDQYERANYMHTLVSYSSDWRRGRESPKP
ncbi:MAG: dihydroorotate dehydrogenase-like protein [Acidimicrobiia bacterium]